MNNIYTAIMKAADHIERNPQEFDYWSTSVPESPHCGTPACAIGWVGAFTGAITAHGEARNVCRAEEVIGISGSVFYARMSAIESGWMHDAHRCASNLRLYAGKYHAPAKPQQQPPDWAALATGRVPDDVRSQEVVCQP